jgi:tRNA threonylcarbamoyladenosine biosynthesis protein TsaB
VSAKRAMVAFETATETVAVAVRTPEGVQAELALTGRRRHVETLTPALAHLLDQVGFVPTDLGVVAVDVGPGLFTGLRVGVAAAKGLAQSLGLGVVTASSLDVLVAGAAAAGHRGLVLACVDARRGEVFATVRAAGRTGAVRADRAEGAEGKDGARGHQPPTVAPGLFAPAALVAALERLGGHSVVAVGDGAQRYADALGAVSGLEVIAPALAFPPPTALLELARADLAAGTAPVEPALVVPLYMREADARSNFARAQRA